MVELRGATRLVPDNLVTCSIGLNGKSGIRAEIINFSRSGLCLKFKEWIDFSQGQTIHVYLSGEGSSLEHRFDATVRWIQKDDLVCLLIGCEFSGLSIGDLRSMSTLFGLSEEFVDPITGLSWIPSDAVF